MFTLTSQQKSFLVKRFRDNYPDFRNFSRPGSLGKEELDYKRKALDKWEQRMGTKAAEKALSKNGGLEVLQALKATVATNIVSYHSWERSFGQNPDAIAEILWACLAAARRADVSLKSIAPVFEAAGKHGLKLDWDALSVVLWAFNPSITHSSFHRIQLHRNTRNYQLLISLCRLIHQCLLPEEHQGKRRFRDILRDETVMHRLFEDFVRNFAARHLTGAKVSAMAIQWQATDLHDTASALLPGMITDVTIAWPDRKLILDCKYYHEALVTRYDALRFRSANLYQLHAYLINMASEPGWENAEGMLLYPSNGYRFDHTFTLHDRHRIRVSTIDLHQPWPEIEKELLELISSDSGSLQNLNQGRD